LRALNAEHENETETDEYERLRRVVEQTIALMCGQTISKWPKTLDGWPKSNFRFGLINGNVNGCRM